jgi:hypothetical protein
MNLWGRTAIKLFFRKGLQHRSVKFLFKDTPAFEVEFLKGHKRGRLVGVSERMTHRDSKKAFGRAVRAGMRFIEEY